MADTPRDEAKKLNSLLDRILGEVTFASRATETLWMSLILNRVLSKDDAQASLDGLLLVMEKNQNVGLIPPASMVYARTRLEFLIQLCAGLRPVPVPPA